MGSEEIEAAVRRLMAQHAAIRARGFDTVRERAELRRQIDDKLDELAVEREIAELDTL